MKKAGYVCAGFETLSQLVNKYIQNSGEELFDKRKVNNFCKSTISGFLHSFGTAVSKKSGKLTEKTINSQVKILEKCRKTGFFDDCLFYVDSGGYQISAGFFDKKQTESLITLYHDFLRNKSDVYDRAFLLDITPGPNDKLFKKEEDVYKYNYLTYNLAKEMPDDVRKKLIYIHHFRTPMLWYAFKRILTDDMFNAFDNFATGGMVASSKADTSIPCVIYVLPLIVLINKAINNKRSSLNFHILGGANPRDIFFYRLFKKHVKEVHNFDLNITYDSSALFKGFMMSRSLPFLVDGQITFIDLRSKSLDMRCKVGNYKNRDIFFDNIKSMASEFSFNLQNCNKVYDKSNKTLLPKISVLGMMYYLYYYYNLENYINSRVEDVYNLYESGEIEKFSIECLKITQSLNGGKITRKQKIKTSSAFISLKMLTDLDEDYCGYIVDNLLSKDEFTHVTNNKTLIF